MLPLLFLVCCQSFPTHQHPTKFSQTAMTINYHISIGDTMSMAKKDEVEEIISATFNEVDAVYNKWNPDSELSRINRHPAHTPFVLSSELSRFLERLDHYVKLSEGRFDPTIEPMQTRWQECLEQGTIPSDEEIHALKPCIGWHTLHFANGTLIKEDSRTQLDLGGAAKGLCVDLLIERLHAAGLEHLYVEWGGEIRTLGKHPSGRSWRVYISRLDNPDPSAAITQLDLNDRALATSGDYFQNWTVKTQEGTVETFSHIFNPLTLRPLQCRPGSVASASLLAKDCVTADALAKVLMLFETADEASKWLAGLQTDDPELACWLVTR